MIDRYLVPSGLKQRIHLGHALLVLLFVVAVVAETVTFYRAVRRIAGLERIGQQQLIQQDISQGAIAIANQAELFISEGHSPAVDRVGQLNERLTRQLGEIARMAASPEMKGSIVEMGDHLVSFNQTNPGLPVSEQRGDGG